MKAGEPVQLEDSFTPDVASEARETKYMTVLSFQKENKVHIKRKIKLILVDHYHDKGIPYQRFADEEADPDSDEDELGGAE